jgi:hypothetical protein
VAERQRPADRSEFPDSDARSSIAAGVTVSGTVSGPSGPVSGVWIGVGSDQADWQTDTTDATGVYSVSIETGGSLWFHVRPPLDSRLTQRNRWVGGVSASFTQDFTVTKGYSLSLQLVQGGTAISGPVNLAVTPLVTRPADHEWFVLEWDEGTERQRGVLPPDIYYVTAHDPPAGSYDTTQAFDLRTGDVSVQMALNATYVHPIPYDPPDGLKISIGPVDDLGEAAVTGGAGAALPLARVLLVNLKSAHQAHTVSEADGSFTARLFAPPGSAVMVKHGPGSHRWDTLNAGVVEGYNPFPGTIINVPHTHGAGEFQVPFAAVGAAHLFIDQAGGGRSCVGAA